MCDKCRREQERAQVARALRERDRHLAYLHAEVKLLWLVLAVVFLWLVLAER